MIRASRREADADGLADGNWVIGCAEVVMEYDVGRRHRMGERGVESFRPGAFEQAAPTRAQYQQRKNE